MGEKLLDGVKALYQNPTACVITKVDKDFRIHGDVRQNICNDTFAVQSVYWWSQKGELKGSMG